jgi:hypothetical protein
MARGPKAAQHTSNDGMSWLALMPFPAFNPLNWWALASPRNAMLASLNNAHLAIDAWRAGADGLRAMMRLQQDELLKMLEAPIEALPEKADGAEVETAAEAHTLEDGEAPAAADFVRPMISPMLEVTRAYGRVGRAFIVAQRDTMRAFAQTSTTSSKPH